MCLPGRRLYLNRLCRRYHLIVMCLILMLGKWEGSKKNEAINRDRN